MKVKEILIGIFSLFILFSIEYKSYAQVSIGIGEPPIGGAVLQMKTIEGVTGAAANSNKGMSLPRVQLTDVNMLYPMFPVGYNKAAQDPLHVGLIVFNTNENLNNNGVGVGIYYWDGKGWKALTGEESLNTIEVSPDKIYLSEFKTSDIGLLATGKNNQKWQLVPSGVEESSTMTSTQSGKSSTLTFTRSNTTFGDKVYTFKLADKPTVEAQILVSNIGLVINKETFRVGEGKVNGAVNSSTAIEAFGGDANWEVLDYSQNTFDWKIPPKNDKGHLVFELGEVLPGSILTSTGSVMGEIRVRHTTERRIIKTIQVEQNKEYRVMPAFDYMVIKYSSTRALTGSVDIDSGTEIIKTNVTAIDKKPIGYKLAFKDVAEDKGIKYMFYAGDDRESGSETVYVDIPSLNKILASYPKSSNQIEIGMGARWYVIGSNSKEAMVTISLYKGGTMVQRDKTYDNVINGVVQKPLLQFVSKGKILKAKSEGAPDISMSMYRQYYTPMFKLEYDRVDNTGVLIQWNNWD